MRAFLFRYGIDILTEDGFVLYGMLIFGIPALSGAAWLYFDCCFQASVFGFVFMFVMVGSAAAGSLLWSLGMWKFVIEPYAEQIKKKEFEEAGKSSKSTS